MLLFFFFEIDFFHVIREKGFQRRLETVPPTFMERSHVLKLNSNELNTEILY